MSNPNPPQSNSGTNSGLGGFTDDQINALIKSKIAEQTKNLWQSMVSPEQVHQIINQQLRNNRPVSWEDDISCNTLNEDPFECLPSPASLDPSSFDRPGKLRTINPLLGDRDLASMIAKDNFPIPIPTDREGYSPGDDPHYWLSGFEDCLKVLDAAKRHGTTVNSIFDFGCATGRVIRHLAAQTDIKEIWGSDINRRHVRWLHQYMPENVKPFFNHCIPSLPMRDGSVDVITAFSVFTHIDTFETHWLAELSRILSDDGIAYLTVHNEDTWAILRDEIDNEKNRLIQSMLRIDPTVREQLMEPMPESRMVYRFAQTGPYRAQVFHSNEYLRRVWGRFFKIEEILPKYHTRQTVMILRKK